MPSKVRRKRRGRKETRDVGVESTSEDKTVSGWKVETTMRYHFTPVRMA